jgi:DNA mismatch endonuclease (patch repair protein)
MPATRTEFWQAKLAGNRSRDQTALEQLTTAGWRVLTIWECALRGPARRPEGAVVEVCEKFLRSERMAGEIAGRWPDATISAWPAADTPVVGDPP